MAKEDTLQRVEADITHEDLGKARDRLMGLINSHPDDLSLRSRVADIDWQLQLPDEAGRYWYLEERFDDTRKYCVAKYEDQCGGDPLKVLNGLKLKMDRTHKFGGFADEQLEKLSQAVSQQYGDILDRNWQPKKAAQKANDDSLGCVVGMGCMIVMIMIIFFFTRVLS